MTFRYHIVTVVSIFLALAVGVALGGGPLKGEVDNSVVASLRQTRQEAAAQKLTLAHQSAFSQFANSVVEQESGKILGHRLAGVSVAVVALPGADPDVVRSLSALVPRAGGRVVGSYDIGTKLLTGTDTQLLDQLGTQLAAQYPGAKVPADATTYERLGVLLARSIAKQASDTRSGYDRASKGIMGSLSGAGLAAAAGTPTGRADAVLVVCDPGPRATGEPGAEAVKHWTKDQRTAAYNVVGTLADELSARAGAVVVAGNSDAARAGGLIEKIRTDVNLAASVSTVDSAGTAVGGAVTMLAIAQDLRAGTGQYGAVSPADGALPGASG